MSNNLPHHLAEYFSFLQIYEPEEDLLLQIEVKLVIFLMDNKYILKELKK